MSRTLPVRFFATAFGREQIVVFDQSGAPIGAFGTPGEGPGELVQTETIASADHGRLVVTRLDGRIVTFDSTGGFLGESRTRFGCRPLIDVPESICTGKWPEADDPDGHVFHLLSAQGDIVQSFGPSAAGPCLMCSGVVGVYGPNPSEQVWAVSGDGGLVQRWMAGGELLSEVHLDKLLDSVGIALSKSTPGVRKLIGASMLPGDSLVLTVTAIDTTTPGEAPTLAMVDGVAIPNPAIERSDESRVAGSIVAIVDPRLGVLSAMAVPRLLRVADRDVLYSVMQDSSGIVRLGISRVWIGIGQPR